MNYPIFHFAVSHRKIPMNYTYLFGARSVIISVYHSAIDKVKPTCGDGTGAAEDPVTTKECC